MWALRHKNRRYTLTKSSISIGQGIECDVVIQSSSVDSEHAALHYVPDVDQYIIRDLGSATGTYVNDERVQGEQGMWLQSYDQVRCGYDAPVLTIERLYSEDNDNSSPGSSLNVNQSVQALAAPPTDSSTQTSPEKYKPFCISPSMQVLPVAYCVPLSTDHMTSHDVTNFPMSQSLPQDIHVQATPTKMAWSVTNDNDDDGDYNHGGHGASHSEGNQTLATPSSDAVDSNYHRQDGRRNVSSKRGSSLYGQPSWWSAPDEDAPLTLQPIHCATKWTEANPTPVKSERLSPAPPDSSKRHSTPVKATSATPRGRSNTVKESKLTTRLIKKITPSSRKGSGSGEKLTTSSSSPASSASNSSSDLSKSSIVRGTPRRETYIKKPTSNSRPRSAEVITSSSSSSSSTTSSSTTLQKPASKFDRRSPQRHTYNKKESMLSKKASSEEPSTASKPEKKPRETVAELRQRMQQAKKAAAASNEAESGVQIFISGNTVATEEATVDRVTDDNSSSNVVSSSSGIPLNGSDNQQTSQRKQWEINEAYSMDHLTLTSLQALSLHLSQLADATCAKVKDFAESSVGKMIIPTYTTNNIADGTSSVNSSQNAIPEWLGSHKEMKGVYRNLRSVEYKLIEISQVIDYPNPHQLHSSSETSSSS